MLTAARSSALISAPGPSAATGRSSILAATNIAVIFALIGLLPTTFVDGFKLVALGILFWLVAACVASSVAVWRGHDVLGTYVFLVGVSLGLFVAMIVPTELTPYWQDGRYLLPAYFLSLPVLAAGGLLFPTAAFVVAGAEALLAILAALARTDGALFTMPGQLIGLLTPLLLMVLVATMSWLYGTNLLASLRRVRQRSEEIEQVTEQLRRSNGDLAAAAASVRQLAAQMAETAEQLTFTSGDLTATSQAQASGSGQQAAAVSEISATIEELSRTAAEIAASAAETLISAEEGRSAVVDTISGMEAIRSRVETTTQRILQLGESSQRIGEITDIISDIANKTHLLALNAAIESAAAGEYGRRFAVVAQQVKELADETKTATTQVKSLIAQTQRATNTSIVSSEQMTKEVELGLVLGGRARQAIEEIVQRSQAISLATHQQESASAQAVANTRDVADVARQSAISAQQLAENARQLSELARSLRQTASELKSEGMPTQA